MANRVIFVSSKCEHCEKLLIGVQQYDILKRTFSIVNIDTDPFPNYIKSVPSLLINNQIVEGEELFEYMGRIVDASGEVEQEQPEQGQQGQQMQGQGQQMQGQGQQMQGQGQQMHGQGQQMQGQQGQQGQPQNQQCSKEDELMGYCTSGSCVDFSTITESSDDYTKSFHTIDTNLSFLDGQTDLVDGSHGSVQLSKDDTFDRSEKRTEFDNDYEKLMSDRNLQQ
jgi:TolA-binding protein